MRKYVPIVLRWKKFLGDGYREGKKIWSAVFVVKGGG